MAKHQPRDGADLSDGVYSTPGDFLAAVRAEFPIAFDLAATVSNRVASRYFTEADDALGRPWPVHPRGQYNWLNPPFDRVGRWARRCYEQSLARSATLLLAPASVGSNWYRDWVYGKAEVRFLNGRLTFGGRADPYPKDLLLAVFELGRKPLQYPWEWRATTTTETADGSLAV